MPDNSAAIVIDIGTTNCKVTCFSCLDATTLGAHKFVTAKQISPQGDVDFDIDALWQEVRQAIAQLNAASPLPVRRISIASFGESGVFLDEHGEILTPMLAWYDRRGEEYLATLSEADSAALYDICGLPLHSNYSAFKMRWLLEHYPLRNRRGLRWLHAPEVLLWRLTGEQRTDITLASRTLCLDVRKGEWSAKATALLHVPCSAFAPLVQPGEHAGWVSESLCKMLQGVIPQPVIMDRHGITLRTTGMMTVRHQTGSNAGSFRTHFSAVTVHGIEQYPCFVIIVIRFGCHKCPAVVQGVHLAGQIAL